MRYGGRQTAISLGATCALLAWSCGRSARGSCTSPDFAVHQDLATGLSPSATAVADVNGDGHPDIVTANQDASSVSVLLANGDGSFRPKADYAVGSTPVSVAIADLNADGRPDIVTANGYAASVSVLIGNGDGTFKAAVDYPVSAATPSSVALADLSGDGKPDIVVANHCDCQPGSVSVLVGNGNGTFRPSVSYPTAAGSLAVAVADLNGDGKADVVTSNGCTGCPTGTVSVLMGNGDGTLKAEVDFPAGGDFGGDAIAIADMNGDLKPDIVTAEYYGSISVLLGNGDGTFKAKTDYPGPNDALSLAIADVNGDGKADVVATNSYYDDPRIGVLLGRGDGSLQPYVTFVTGSLPVSVAVADLNRDGRPDIVTANADANSVSVLLNACGDLPPSPDTSKVLREASGLLAATASDVLLYDANGDHRLTIIDAVAVARKAAHPVTGPSIVLRKAGGLQTASASDLQLYDQNADHRLTLVDAVRIARKAAGL